MSADPHLDIAAAVLRARRGRHDDAPTLTAVICSELDVTGVTDPIAQHTIIRLVNIATLLAASVSATHTILTGQPMSYLEAIDQAIATLEQA